MFSSSLSSWRCQIKGPKMGGVCSTHDAVGDVCTISAGKFKGRDHFKDEGVNGE